MASVLLSLTAACAADATSSQDPGDPSDNTPAQSDAGRPPPGTTLPPGNGSPDASAPVPDASADPGPTPPPVPPGPTDSGTPPAPDASAPDAGGPGPTPPPPPPPPPGGGPTSLPTPAGACPDFANGAVKFNPKGGARDVTLYMSQAAKTKHGPLIFYYYGTGGAPSQVQQAFGTTVLNAIEAAGGIVVAPTNVQSGQFPWLGGDPTPDYLLVDEVVGCAIQKVGIDTSHIHSLGFSAGALFTTQLAFARSSFIASIGTFSGGLTGSAPPYQAPSNKWAAMAMTGGTSDNVFGTDFLQASTALQTKLKADGHFAMLCNHGGGHSMPQKYQAPVWQFFQDHPFGRDPSPYAGGLPSGFTGCTP